MHYVHSHMIVCGLTYPKIDPFRVPSVGAILSPIPRPCLPNGTLVY